MSELFKLFEKKDHESWSGDIEFRSSQGFATVRIDQGRFVWAHRPIDRAAERLSRVSWLKVPPAQELSRFKDWGQFVDRLLDDNSDQAEKLVRLLKMDRLEVFFRIFFWSNVEIVENQRTKNASSSESLSFYTSRGFDKLLGEAQLRLAEWPKMKQRIGSSKRVFISLIQTKLAKEENSGSNAYSPEEVEIIESCNGRNSIQDLVKTLPYGEYLIVKHLLDLSRRGAIRAKDDDSAPVSVVYERDGLSALDFVGAGWSALFAALIYGLLQLWMPWSEDTSCQSTALTQALEIYRLQKQHYPLTLRELPMAHLPVKALDDYNYTLSNPVSYDLTCRKSVVK